MNSIRNENACCQCYFTLNCKIAPVNAQKCQHFVGVLILDVMYCCMRLFFGIAEFDFLLLLLLSSFCHNLIIIDFIYYKLIWYKIQISHRFHFCNFLFFCRYIRVHVMNLLSLYLTCHCTSWFNYCHLGEEWMKYRFNAAGVWFLFFLCKSKI
jgi:hypothetical protein